MTTALPGQAQSGGPPAHLANPGSGLGAGVLVPRGGAGEFPSLLSPAPELAPGTLAPGQVALQVSARFGLDGAPIPAGLHWRVYAEKPDPAGNHRLLREAQSAAPTFVLPPGGYVVHVGLGLASATRRVLLRAEPVREVIDLHAGGLRLEGRVGDVRIPATQIHFEIYAGSQFDPGERRLVAAKVATGDVVMLPEGTYNITSNYGDANAVVRSDIRVQTGRLTDAIVTHQAAVITLKLVNERGGEALANTAWSVLTPGGDVIKESIGAFPRVVLAEGDYRAIARNEGRVFERAFKVHSGVDGEIEVLAR